MVVKNNKVNVLFGMFVLFVVTELTSMDSPRESQEAISAKQSENVFVKTQDGKVEAVERRNINQMKVLSVLLEHQKGKNSKNNPIDAFMVTAKELELLNNALNAANRNEFGKFYEELSKGLGIGTVGEGDLRLLINAAQRVEATGLSALCSSYFLPLDVQKLLIPTFIQPSIDCLKNIIIKKYAEDRKIVLVGHSKVVKSAKFSPDGSKIVSACDDDEDNLMVWDVATGKRIHNLVGHYDSVNSASFSRDGSKIVSTCRDDIGNLIMWDVATGKQIHNLTGHDDIVNSASFSPDGSKIVSGGDGNRDNLMVWDVATGKQIHNLTGHRDYVISVTFSPDGSKIVSGGSGNQNNLMVWNVVTGKQIHNLAGYPGSVISATFSPDGSKIVSGGDGNRDNLMVWDVATGKQIHNLTGHRDYVISVTFSPDGSKIVSGGSGNRNNLMVWDVATGKQIHNLAGHPDDVRSAAFSHDGSKIVSGCGGNQNNLIIWNVATGSQIHSFAAHNGGVRSVAFSSDGRKIVSGGGSVGKGIKSYLILWILLTDQEEAILNNLNKCTIVQARLLYQLCLASQQGIVVNLSDADALTFISLPQLVKDLLQSSVMMPSKNQQIKPLLLSTQTQVQKKQEVAPSTQKIAAPTRTAQQMHEQQGLARKKEEIRRSLTHPKFNDKKLLAEHIQALKSIYTPGHDYHEAFNEVVKEMGY